MPTVLHKGFIIPVAIGIIAIISGLFLPDFTALRERARRVKDLENLNAIWKVISEWGLAPSNSGILSLDQLVKSKSIAPDMLFNHETGKPIEYYPVSSNNEGNHVILVSRGKHGMNVIKVAGQGMWVDDGTPRDANLFGSRLNLWLIGLGFVTLLLAGSYWISGRSKAKSGPHLT